MENPFMNKHKYETLVLAHPQITADELSMIENYFEKITDEATGELLNFDKWGKYRLAYPIQKNDYGIYILIRYELPLDKLSQIFKEIETFFKIKCNETVMRSVTRKLSDNVPKVYKYPEPIDASKSANLDDFIKENKMEGFLGNVKEATSASNETKEDEAKE
ncbi:hypothetical protein GF322_03205 [Candidatus Dependentiae bacterium]|nr:hypothetical protein [Candidatus Dependentiae bacterium]